MFFFHQVSCFIILEVHIIYEHNIWVYLVRFLRSLKTTNYMLQTLEQGLIGVSYMHLLPYNSLIRQKDKFFTLKMQLTCFLLFFLLRTPTLMASYVLETCDNIRYIEIVETWFNYLLIVWSCKHMPYVVIAVDWVDRVDIVRSCKSELWLT